MILSCSFTLWLSPHLIREAVVIRVLSFFESLRRLVRAILFRDRNKPSRNKRDRKRTGNRPSKNKNANADHDDCRHNNMGASSTAVHSIDITNLIPHRCLDHRGATAGDDDDDALSRWRSDRLHRQGGELHPPSTERTLSRRSDRCYSIER